MAKYKLTFLRDFFNDLTEITHYIACDLNNPQAAEALADKIDAAIIRRLEMPTAFEPYHSKKQREHDYYRIYVGNYTIFYVVIGDTMEVRRLIYSARDIENML